MKLPSLYKTVTPCLMHPSDTPPRFRSWRLLLWVVFSSAIVGTVFLAIPDIFNSPGGAYSWAFGILPPWAFGSLLLVTSAVGSLVLWGPLKSHWQYPVLAVYSFVQFLFAASILTLTWNGAPGAVVGALQWLGYLYFTMIVLTDRTAPENRRG
jgi:hypothetical protein